MVKVKGPRQRQAWSQQAQTDWEAQPGLGQRSEGRLCTQNMFIYQLEVESDDRH